MADVSNLEAQEAAAQDSAGPDSAAQERAHDARARRIEARFQTEFVGKQVEGTGIVRNISLTGALIEECSSLLLAGGDVRLAFSFFEGSTPVKIRAKTVRETETGFGVRFVGMDPRTKAILAQAIARAETDPPEATDPRRTTTKTQPLFKKNR